MSGEQPRVGPDDLDECWCCGGLHDSLKKLCPDCDDAGCKHFGGECQSDHKPVMPDGGRPGVGTGQTALHPPQDPETPATVWVVAANYADDPHPHIEAVYDNEEAARQHEQEIQDDIRPSAPIAWWVYEETVKEESYAE